MTNEMKLLRAFIEAQGYEIEETQTKSWCVRVQSGVNPGTNTPRFTDSYNYITDYKVTKRAFNKKPTLHKIIREYEKYGMTASEMIGRIMLLEGITDNDL